MAKKKTSSKSSKQLDLILKVVVVVLGVAALCMGFLAAVNFATSKGAVEGTYTGFQVVFGYHPTTKSVLGDVTQHHLGFSFMALLAFVLPVAGAVMSIFKNKIVRIVGAVLMIVGAVLMFLVPSFAVLATVDGKLTLISAVLDACTRTLGIGAILGGVFSALGGLVAGYSIFKK